MTDKRLIRRPLNDRFYAKVFKTEGCWIWTGAKDKFGYGSIGSGGWHGATLKAHRVSYEIHVGSIPNGKHVLHRCDNPRCVRPTHLFLGTHADNMADSAAKGRAKGPSLKGEQNPNRRFTASEIRFIRRQAAKGTPRPALAAQFGTSRQNIGFIVRRDTWSHI